VRQGDGSTAGPRLFVVDDEPANVELLGEVLGRAGYRDVVCTTDPRHAVELCTESAPDLLLLDLHMPQLDGFEVLALLDGVREGAGHFPVLMLTADTTLEARRRALASGATDFVVKPIDAVEVAIRVRNLVTMHRLQSQLRDEKALLEGAVRERTAELELAHGEILERLALAAEFRDDETQEHAQRIGRSAAMIAATLGVDADLCDAIGRAALLHDVGKLAIPDAILLKPTALTASEHDVIKTHTTIGARILASSRSDLLRVAEEIALTHHEHWSGAGYPRGLNGDRIPLSGRIVAVADVFDALTHSRPYKDAWPVPEALEEIAAQRGGQFDPDVVDGFLTLDPADLLEPVA
jgi:putative two-component system response regulator